MAVLLHLPERLKTYDVSGNTVLPSGANGTQHAAQAFVNAKNYILQFAPRVTTVGSSDGVTAGLDLADRITDRTKVVAAAAGTAHSWWVGKLTATGQQFLIDFNSATGAYIATLVQSPGGLFTGGSTTARPTAIDEVVSRSATDWLIGNSTAQLNITAWCSQDGESLAVMFSVTTSLQAGWFIGKVYDPRSWITLPYYFCSFSSGGASNHNGAIKFLNPSSNDSFSCKGPTNANVRLRLTGRIGYTSFILTLTPAVNTFTGAYPVEQPSLFNITAPDAGPYGRLADFLLTSGPTHGAIAQDPTVPDRIALVLGCWAMPWYNSSWAVP